VIPVHTSRRLLKIAARFCELVELPPSPSSNSLLELARLGPALLSWLRSFQPMARDAKPFFALARAVA